MQTKNNALFYGIGIILCLFLFFQAFYVVYPRQQVAVKRFGQIVRVSQNPGFYFKLPLLETPISVDNRLRRYDLPTQSIQVKGGAYYEVDAFFIYRIVDSKLFLQKVQMGQPRIAETNNLAPRFIDALRAVYGKRDFQAALSDERSAMMKEVQEQFSKDAGSLGIKIIDVRIRKTDLTDAVSEDIYKQMAAERLAVAEAIRARGQQERDRIVAEANRDYTEIVAKAVRDSEILRGEGQAESTQIMLEAIRENPQFYAFWEALNQYKKLKDTPWIISPKMPFFQYLNDPNLTGFKDNFFIEKK